MRITARVLERMIVYEDGAVLVVHKPPFLAVETKNIRQQDLVSLLQNRRAAQGETGGVYLIHRLDQPVEGLLVLAKTKKAAAALGKDLAGSGFSKEYFAVVQGVTDERGTLVHRLKKDGRTNTSVVVPEAGDAGKADGTHRQPSDERKENEDFMQPSGVWKADGDLTQAPGEQKTDGKFARLSYERLAVRENNSLLRICLDTGRHHQIRVQFAAIGHPLVGDVKYGGSKGAQPSPLALCSSRLCFTHPDSGERMEFSIVPTGSGFLGFSDVLSKTVSPA